MSMALTIAIIILALLYVWQVTWIFRDCKRREDELIWIWGILSLVSFPIVLIIYLIFTRCNSKANRRYNNMSNSCLEQVAVNTCSKCKFPVENEWNYCPNCNENLRKSYVSIKSNRRLGGVCTSIFIIGIVVFAVFLTYSIKGLKNSILQVSVPGTSIITLKDSGRYTIFYEYDSEDEEDLNYYKVKDLNVTLTDVKTNNIVPILKASRSSNYSFGGSHGTSFLKFKIEEPGSYKLDVVYKNNSEDKLIISIGNNFINRILLIVFGSLTIVFGTILAGVFIIVSSVRKRRF